MATAQLTRTARNATAIALATLLARGIQFGWSLLLARLLGQADFGLYGIIGGMLSTAASIPEFGMGLIVLRDVAHQPSLGGKYLTATLVIQPFLAVLAYLGLIGVVLLTPTESTTRLLLLLAGISLIVDTLGNMGYNQLIAIEQMVTASTILVIHIGLLIVFAYAAVASGGGLPGLYVATICAGVFRIALFWIALGRASIFPQWPLDFSVVRKLFRDGWPLALGSFLRLIYQHIDKILVIVILGDNDYGHIQAGYLVAAFIIVFGVIDLINTTILTAIFPAMSRLVNEPRALRAISEQIAFLTLVITLPVGIGISALSPVLADLLFPGFKGTAAVLSVLIWHSVVAMVGNVYAQGMIIQNRQQRMLIIRSVGLVATIALNILLMPPDRLGVTGAAVASLISESIVIVWLLYEQHLTRAELGTLSGRVVKVLVAGAVMAVVAYPFRTINPYLAVFAGISAGLIYLALIVVLKALSEGEWALLRNAARALPVVGPVIGRAWAG
jgi:O-antigen/teichoic acid export membrane protein